VIRPGRDPKVLPERITTIPVTQVAEPRPAPHPRRPAIGADDPARFDLPLSEVNSVGRNARDRRAPQQLNSHFSCSVGDQLVQRSSPYSLAYGIVWKLRRNRKAAAQEPYAAEAVRILLRQRHSQAIQRGDSIWHQSFAARFVDRELRSIGYRDAESLLPRCDGRRQSCGAASNHKYIS
jgi:hypothetical protein